MALNETTGQYIERMHDLITGGEIAEACKLAYACGKKVYLTDDQKEAYPGVSRILKMVKKNPLG